MSGAALPGVAPQIQPPAPNLEPVSEPPKHRPWWILGLVIVVLAAAAYLYSRLQAGAQESGGKTGPAPIRTAQVVRGRLDRTIRLCGTTGAAKFSTLISPVLRGSRSDSSRDAKSYDSGLQDYQVTSNGPSTSGSTSAVTNSSSPATTSSATSASGSSSGGGSSNSGSSSSSPATTNTAASTNSSVQSTAGTGSSGNNLSTALQSATSRVSGSSATSSHISPSSTSRTAPLSSDSDLGSTASQLSGGSSGPGAIGGSGGGGGGGGGGDYTLVLQHVVPPGSHVKKGDTVAEFDRQYMLLRLDDYRAAIAQTRDAVNKLKAELAVALKAHEQTVGVAKADLDKAELDMKTIPVLGVMDAERLKLARDQAEAHYKQLLAEVPFVEAGQKALIRSAELDLERGEVELKRAEINADKMLLKAPLNGLTVMQNIFRGSEFSQIQEGDQLWPGLSVMQIVDTSAMVVNATVNQADVEHIRIGQKAIVRFDAYPDLALPAHIYAIAAITTPGGMRAQYLKEVPVKLKLDQEDPRVIPDLSVSADVVLESQEDAAVLPLAAVFRDAPGKTPYVYVKSGDAWDRRDVELGLTSNISAAVKSGVKQGEVLALEPPPKPSDKEQS